LHRRGTAVSIASGMLGDDFRALQSHTIITWVQVQGSDSPQSAEHELTTRYVQGWLRMNGTRFSLWRPYCPVLALLTLGSPEGVNDWTKSVGSWVKELLCLVSTICRIMPCNLNWFMRNSPKVKTVLPCTSSNHLLGCEVHCRTWDADIQK